MKRPVWVIQLTTKRRRAIRWVKALRITTELDTLRAGLEAQRRVADRAQREKREAHRLLVLLSEPLKDWDLADFPGVAWGHCQGQPFCQVHPEAKRHLSAIREAYQLTAPAVAPLRAGMKLHDRARQQGWDDQPLPRQRRPRP